ncbi:CvfD/Ygs/GSP13 family RNA-binding post-transcriptional regulator [Lentilactobacillus parakefiri]|uniref:General stress protein n=1 Tax=Lentilactobacillus parakefiri TaxID=152332 RepID=A0A269Y5S4_9LACO|nr:CvfD/Ygs/GSP13 family RNA-binding post-transcriptional regulator [Lentilactobacillus parakefiri]PAK80907.1 general stress protein [Lentilactobacillus parakefiri]PAK99632.1 general stress protein [Lentilactobacillus parakefiri]TDG93973.1 hypothetical protein C5L28_000130 [Lentilactobacillus parakefiri]GAW72348.1 RNA-binding protein [Lentilactobacillus parakefiri]
MGFKVGMSVNGVVTGIQPYGVFLDIGEHTQGLIHISECRTGFVDNLNEIFRVGETVTALIIDIDEYSGKISLSTRSSEVNPEILRRPKSFRPARVRYWTNYRLNIGFKPLARAKADWMKDAQNFFR